MEIRVNLDPIKSTTTLPYVGREVTFNNSDWEALYINLRKAPWKLGMVEMVLVNRGGTTKAREMMYKAVVQAVLLYGSEIWVVTDEMMAVLEGFHHSIGRRIAGMTEQREDIGE